MNESASKTPIHFWIVAIISLLWNSAGAFDYIATQTKMESYMSQFSPQQLDYFYAFPVWMVAAWAIAIWASLLGSVALLLRKAWAVWLFAVALAGVAVSTVYNFVLSNGAEIMGQGAVLFTVLIWAVALFLYFYARAMSGKGVLRD
ncbi:MAG: hypothetical protein HKO64_02910 [Xanthomonadales bacterium]|nr:hypothetical protein [Xanthomonadales bacterium]NNL94547.1 hypothetical protein [Xanthomonadales bacterium]